MILNNINKIKTGWQIGYQLALFDFLYRQQAYIVLKKMRAACSEFTRETIYKIKHHSKSSKRKKMPENGATQATLCIISL